ERGAPPGEIDLALGVELGSRADDRHLARTLAAAHSHCARTPSSSETRGVQPSSERIRVVSALVRRWSPGTGSPRRPSRVRPAIRSKSAIVSLRDAAWAPPTLYVPRPRPIAAIVASTTSETYVQPRDWSPSP